MLPISAIPRSHDPALTPFCTSQDCQAIRDYKDMSPSNVEGRMARSYSTVSAPDLHDQHLFTRRWSKAKAESDLLPRWEEDLPMMSGRVIMASAISSRKMSWPPTTVISDFDTPSLWEYDVENGVHVVLPLGSRERAQITRAHNDATKFYAIGVLLSLLCLATLLICSSHGGFLRNLL